MGAKKILGKSMTRIFALVISFALMISGLYGFHVQGTLVFTFTPTGTQGSSGTWKAVVVGPSGTRFSTNSIDCFSTDQVAMEIVNQGMGHIEVGCYMIELICNIDGQISAPFLDRITVQFTSPYMDWDTITYRNFPTLANGEKGMLYYCIPSIE